MASRKWAFALSEFRYQQEVYSVAHVRPKISSQSRAIQKTQKRRKGKHEFLKMNAFHRPDISVEGDN